MALPRSAGPDPLIVAVATFQVLFGVMVAYALAPQMWLADATRNLAAAADLVAGRFGADPVYLYSPLAAALTVPATAIPPAVAGGAWLLLRVGVVTAAVRHATAERTPTERVLILVGVLAFVPVLVDLMLGNVSILLAAAVAVVAWSPDRSRTGILLGLA
ncbi:MAG TPA: glycosyltransferase 87 family protein, partial [Candidatus Acidoferrum sp.]|nr:glycosyltransferase 87 family protein [Candidatus Acidoferrum sp.]